MKTTPRVRGSRANFNPRSAVESGACDVREDARRACRAEARVIRDCDVMLACAPALREKARPDLFIRTRPFITLTNRCAGSAPFVSTGTQEAADCFKLRSIATGRLQLLSVVLEMTAFHFTGDRTALYRQGDTFRPCSALRLSVDSELML